MTMAARKLTPSIGEPKVHNHLLGDFAALDEAMDRDGYWFFRNILDKDAVARLRRIYLEELEKLDLIDPVGDAPTEWSVRFSGRGDVTNLPVQFPSITDRRGWQAFIAEPPIHDFFTTLLGEEPFWKPITVYRTTPPDPNSAANRFQHIHQDGPATPGVEFLTLWIPIAEIDADMGGIIFAEGFTDKVNYAHVDATGTSKSIPYGALPEDCWRHTTYRPGDILFMHSYTPHCGVTNISDRFRLSVDHRVMRRGVKRPIIGEVVSIAPDRIELRDESGVTALRIEPETYVRTAKHQRLHGQEIVAEYQPGTKAIVGYDDGMVTSLRPLPLSEY